MVFFLDDELIEKGPHQPNYYDFIQNILIAYKEGKHLVIISPKNVTRLIKDQEVDKTSNLYLRYYLSHERDALSLLSFFEIIVRVVPIGIEGNCYCDLHSKSEIREIHFSALIDTSTIQKTILLGENGNDSEVYAIFSEYYRQYHKLDTCQAVFKRQSGGGDPTAAEFKNIYEKGEEFCLCILDSDKRTPFNDHGQTARKVKKFFERASMINLNLKCHYHILETLEVENLFPRHFYANEYSTKDFDLTHERISILETQNKDCLCHYDYKQGIKLFQDQESNAFCDYWYPIISSNNFNPVNDKNGVGYLNGFGSNIVERFLEHEKDKIYNYLSELTELQNTWLKIGKLVSSFILGTTRKRVI